MKATALQMNSNIVADILQNSSSASAYLQIHNTAPKSRNWPDTLCAKLLLQHIPGI